MSNQLPSVEGRSSQFVQAIPVINVGTDGIAVGANAKQQYTLLTNQAAIGNGAQAGPISGGDYVWRTTATNWNGSTATLQFLDLDGTTWAAVTGVTAMTANGQQSIGAAQGSILRVAVTAAAPTGMNSQIAGL